VFICGKVVLAFIAQCVRAPRDASRGGGHDGSGAERRLPGAPLTFSRAVTVWDTIPGVDRRGAEPLVAEWGTDMAQGSRERHNTGRRWHSQAFLLKRRQWSIAHIVV
jgi:hypothetical protein